MDSGKIFGSDEDSRSCGESGWTTYLVSTHDHDYDNYSDDGDSSGGDSMDSDASSGPVKATPCLKLTQETTEPNCLKKKKATEEKVLVETRVHNDNDDDDDNHDYDDGDNPDYDDGDNHDYDDGNDSHSAVHSYVRSV